jgi:ubiquinone/menaquinone biosynthesis C-methylase UbiE
MSGPFHPTAGLYDLVHGHVDYGAHAAEIAAVFDARHPSPRSLLDVACGTGRHLEIWRGRFDEVAGVDLDEGLLAEAGRRLPEVTLAAGDMRRFDLGRRFDVVTCLFSGIGYMQTVADLHGAVATMAAHLEPGGVLVVEPWLWPSQIETPERIRVHVAEAPGVVVARTARWRNPATWREEGISRMEFTYLVTTAEGSEVRSEQHDMGLFTPEQYVGALAAAGLDTEFDPVGPMARGLAIGVSRP